MHLKYCTCPFSIEEPITASDLKRSIQQPNIQQNPIQPQGPDCGHRIIIDARPTQPDSLTSNIMPGLLNGLMTNV